MVTKKDILESLTNEWLTTNLIRKKLKGSPHNATVLTLLNQMFYEDKSIERDVRGRIKYWKNKSEETKTN